MNYCRIISEHQPSNLFLPEKVLIRTLDNLPQSGTKATVAPNSEPGLIEGL